MNAEDFQVKIVNLLLYDLKYYVWGIFHFACNLYTKLSSNPDLAGIIKSDIINLCEKYPFVNLSHYGFIPKWEDLYFKVLDSMSNRIQM